MSAAPLRYHHPFPLSARIMLGLGALIPLWGAYDLLIGQGMPLFEWGMAPFVAIGLIALCFGLIFLGVAIFGGGRTVTIDRASRLCHVDFDGTFGIHRRFTHPLPQFGAPRVAEITSSDGPSHWMVELPRATKPLRVESYADEARAKAEAATIATYIAGR